MFKNTAVIEMSGKRYGRWMVVRRADAIYGRRSAWLCMCDCGIERVVDGYTLRCGDSASCGCWSAEAAKGRCGPNHQNWKGGEREARIRRAYNITSEQYSALLAAQGGVCKICGHPE